MEFEALVIARARAEALRAALERLVEGAVDHPEGLVVLNRRDYDEARALLLTEDQKWPEPT